MTQLALSRQQMNLFVDVFLLGNELHAADDTSAVVRLLKRVCPGEYSLVVVEAWQLIRSRQFTAARPLLEEADAANPKQPMLKALLAFCLLAQGDSLWRSYLDEVHSLPPNDDVQTIVRTLEEFAQNCPPGATGPQMAIMASLLN
jgi:thioredoxin-like negative regulator of GroEL